MEITKTTSQERKANDRALEQVIFAFYTMEIEGVKTHLGDEGKFFGYDKTMFLARLNSFFNTMAFGELFGICAKKGICLDYLPGCIVIEVRYVTDMSLVNEEGMYSFKMNDPVQEGEVRKVFACKMKNGKIVEITNTKKYAEIQQLVEADDNIVYN